MREPTLLYMNRSEVILGQEYPVFLHLENGNEREMIRVQEPHTGEYYYVSVEGAKAFKSRSAKWPLPSEIKMEVMKKLGEDFVFLAKEARKRRVADVLELVIRNHFGYDY